MPNSIETQPYAAGSPAQNLATTTSWWGLVWTLLIFVIILILVLWVVRRLNRSAWRGLDAAWARVLDRQLLGGQQVLYLVEIAGKLQVLAGSDHYLTKLTEIEDPNLAAEILDELAHRPVERMEGFLTTIQRVLPKSKRNRPFARELAHMLEEEDR